MALWRTSDGGVTWLALSPNGFAETQCKERLVFLDSLHGFLGAWDPNAAPVIYRTADGGQNWTASRPLPDPPGFTTTGGGFTLRADAVRGFGTTLLVDAVGNNDGRLRRYAFSSTDEGASWTYRNTAPDPMIPVTFVTAARWLQFSGTGQSQETTDGGRSWHGFATDYSETAPSDVVFSDPQVGYATAPGTLKRTLDSGAHWTSLRTPGT